MIISKTKKIKRLSKKVEGLLKEVAFLKWNNKQLFDDMKYHARKFKEPTPPPVFRSNNYYEEKELNALVEYVYRRMDESYQKALDDCPRSYISDIKFCLYLDRAVYYKLARVSGYNDFRVYKGTNITFGDHQVVLVEDEGHCNFVRIK